MPDTSRPATGRRPLSDKKEITDGPHTIHGQNILFPHCIARQPIKEKGTFYFLLTTFVFF